MKTKLTNNYDSEKKKKNWCENKNRNEIYKK